MSAANASVHLQPGWMLAVGDEEGVHSAGALQAAHRSAKVEGFPRLDGNKVLGSVHNLGNDGLVSQIQAK